jgi:ABC transporter DrrB family efflux protein
MTAIAERTVGPVGAPDWRVRFRWAVTDTLTITRRNLLVWMRVPAYIFFTLVQPVIFVLMFRYVFGGAIRVSSAGGYVNFLMPGIIAQTAAFATFGTAIALAIELKKGVIDRLRSMPMARSAVLTGRLVADTLRMAVTILVIIAVGYAVGFRFHNGIAAAIAMFVLAVVFGVAISCISAFVGLAIGDEESVQAFGLIWIFPITFLSSAFVPIATMPGWLQAFANNQPVTYTIDAMRALAEGGPLEPSLWKSLVWLAGIFIVFIPLAVRAYRRAALDRGCGAAAVGAGEDLQQVPVGVFEVQAAAAVAVVDGLALGPARIGPVGQVPLPDAVVGGVELDLADQERVVLRGDRAGGLGEIEGDVVVRLDHQEVAEAGRRGQAEDLGQERRRAFLVPARDDGVVQLDAHAVFPVSWRCISSTSLVRPRMGRTITVKPVSWPSSFQRSMSTPWTYRPSSSASNSSTALDGPYHSPT